MEGVLNTLWDRGHLNFGLLQKMGRLGYEPTRRRFLGFAKRRLGIEDDEERAKLFEYFYQEINAQRLSADAWVNALLRPVRGIVRGEATRGIYGRRPLAAEPKEVLERMPPTTVIYGTADWMWSPAVEDAVEEIGGTLHIVEGGKHHLYLDHPQEFRALVESALLHPEAQ